MGARAWPFGSLRPSPVCLGCGTRFAQTVLAPKSVRDRGAATPAGALKWRHEMARVQLQTQRRWILDY